MISDRHAHNKTDVSIHRSMGVRECSISREGQPAPPCHPEEEEQDGGKCRANSICLQSDSSNCDDQHFCRDVIMMDEQTTSSSSIPTISQELTMSLVSYIITKIALTL